jgi:hypothetical protein
MICEAQYLISIYLLNQIYGVFCILECKTGTLVSFPYIWFLFRIIPKFQNQKESQRNITIISILDLIIGKYVSIHSSLLSLINWKNFFEALSIFKLQKYQLSPLSIYRRLYYVFFGHASRD